METYRFACPGAPACHRAYAEPQALKAHTLCCEHAQARILPAWNASMTPAQGFAASRVFYHDRSLGNITICRRGVVEFNRGRDRFIHSSY
ncbi:hypothetical protein BOX15_Mlig021043g2 [Macrostomum lignano]|uniref:Uncharacterized protein n=1 Tax=Macrostomum lignano TaxID=282301 RepID=A0A267EMA0_9PLAT|nr:hypothetical protein BOX15_Mlig021043g1 [Macrostomum lignano]PAA93007.1 hypothetical protein BOX15_Mlig021043g2 [Macrostomum lignano]